MRERAWMPGPVFATGRGAEMSGGCYGYLYARIDDLAELVEERRDTPLRRAFGLHLRFVAKAVHAVEWVDSCDWPPGAEDAAILDALYTSRRLAAAMDRTDASLRTLGDVLTGASTCRADTAPSEPTARAQRCRKCGELPETTGACGAFADGESFSPRSLEAIEPYAGADEPTDGAASALQTRPDGRDVSEADEALGAREGLPPSGSIPRHL